MMVVIVYTLDQNNIEHFNQNGSVTYVRVLHQEPGQT